MRRAHFSLNYNSKFESLARKSVVFSRFISNWQRRCEWLLGALFSLIINFPKQLVPNFTLNAHRCNLCFCNDFISDSTLKNPKPRLHFRYPQFPNPKPSENQSPPMAAASSSSSNDVTSAPEFEVPEGWILVTKHNKKGELIKYYTNVLKQRFYSEFELMRNINYSKSRGYNLYAPNFVPPTTGPFAMRGTLKVDAASTSSSKRITRSQARREAQRARSSLKISGQGNGERPEVDGDCWSSTEVPK